MSSSTEIVDLIKDFAHDLGDVLPDPAAWGIWLSYLVEVLEEQAAIGEQPVENFDTSMAVLRNRINEILARHQG